MWPLNSVATKWQVTKCFSLGLKSMYAIQFMYTCVLYISACDQVMEKTSNRNHCYEWEIRIKPVISLTTYLSKIFLILKEKESSTQVITQWQGHLHTGHGATLL